MLFSIGSLIQLICYALIILIFIRVAFSWFRPSDPWRGPDFSNPIFRISYQLTEPILAPVRRASLPDRMFSSKPLRLMSPRFCAAVCSTS